jgi:hypothetical protein
VSEKLQRLTKRQREFVCRELAEYVPPGEVAAAFEVEFGQPIAPTTVAYYSTSRRWGPVIAEMRRRLIDRLDRIPISSRFWRLKQLQALFEHERETEERRHLLAAARQELADIDFSPDLRSVEIRIRMIPGVDKDGGNVHTVQISEGEGPPE